MNINWLVRLNGWKIHAYRQAVGLRLRALCGYQSLPQDLATSSGYVYGQWRLAYCEQCFNKVLQYKESA